MPASSWSTPGPESLPNRAPEEHDDLAWFEENQLAGLVLADPDLLPIVVGELRRAGNRTRTLQNDWSPDADLL